MNTFIYIIIAYGIYLLISYITEAIVLITNSLSRKAVGAIGTILCAISMFFWSNFGPSNGTTPFYIGAVLLSINLVLSSANLAIGILSCDSKNG